MFENLYAYLYIGMYIYYRTEQEYKKNKCNIPILYSFIKHNLPYFNEGLSKFII